MSAEATSATGTLLLAQDTAKELVAAHKRIRELEAEVEALARQLDATRVNDRIGDEWA